MPPTRRQVNVLITGFGPFMSVVTNPSWLSVKPLHNMRLCSTTPDRTSESGEGVRIQTLQVPVHYSSVLDLVPRLHGRTPRSGTFWHDPRLDSPHGGTAGQVYPDGYPIDHPASGYDVVIHVGVGRGGSIRLETLAHKHSYDKPDTASSLAPSLSPSRRGFGEGYEEFGDIEQTTINIGELVGWLKRRVWRWTRAGTQVGTCATLSTTPHSPTPPVPRCCSSTFRRWRMAPASKRAPR